MVDEILWAGETALISELRAEAFRNYEGVSLEFAPGFNLIFGANAQGKTNLLEAAYLVCSGRLLRSGRDVDAIREGSDGATIAATTGIRSEEVRVVLQCGASKRVDFNGNRLKRACDLLGRNPAIALGSADARIVNGDPADRRAFLDTELSQLYPRYLDALSKYKRALDQRNALLRRAIDAPVPDDLFRVWEQAMAQNGAFLRSTRIHSLSQISEHAARAHQELGEYESIALDYVTKDECEDEEAQLNQLALSRRDDIRRGSSSVGPHRDDFFIRIEGREARLFASQGQRRTAMISIKIGLWRVASEVLRRPAILMLDDIFSDLDRSRRSRLSLMLAGHSGQAILTCTERELAGMAGFEPAASFVVEAGTVKRV